jgi:hypothetical protein
MSLITRRAADAGKRIAWCEDFRGGDNAAEEGILDERTRVSARVTESRHDDEGESIIQYFCDVVVAVAM